MPQIVDKMRNLLRDESLKSQQKLLEPDDENEISLDCRQSLMKIRSFFFQIVQKSTLF